MRDLLIILLGLCTCACHKQNDFLYNSDFSDLKSVAIETGKPFCIILTDDNCTACDFFIKKICSSPYRQLLSRSHFSINSTTLPMNRWLRHWLGTPDSPCACLFSSSGKLTAIISGTTSDAMECLSRAINNGYSDCLERYFSTPFKHSSNKELFEIMNKTLALKQRMDSGENVEIGLLRLLQYSQTPYIYYLLCQNYARYGNPEDAVAYANTFLSYANRFYNIMVWADLFVEARKIVDPLFVPEKAGLLYCPSPIVLQNIEPGKPAIFTIPLSNQGQHTLTVHDLFISSGKQIHLVGQKPDSIPPGETIHLSFQLTAEQNSINRYIAIASDGIIPLTRVDIQTIFK